MKVMYNNMGEITTEKSEMVGRPTKYKLIHPDHILFVDETGCNTNMKQDGHVGGELFVLPMDYMDCGVSGVVTDMHFSVLCFTSGTGHPVLCSIILKSNKEISEIPMNWKLGIDIRRDLTRNTNNVEFVRANIGEGTSLPGGQRCTYRGKELPCFVGFSPNASITSEMLANMLKQIDEFHVFDRKDGVKPFLLLDGHHSRLKLPFLRYINDDKRRYRYRTILIQELQATCQ
jgi:hypothetical protein